MYIFNPKTNSKIIKYKNTFIRIEYFHYSLNFNSKLVIKYQHGYCYIVCKLDTSLPLS